MSHGARKDFFVTLTAEQHSLELDRCLDAVCEPRRFFRFDVSLRAFGIWTRVASLTPVP